MVHLTTSTKKRDQIVDYNGYMYCFKRQNEETLFWVCRVAGCRGQGRNPINYVNSLHLWELEEIREKYVRIETELEEYLDDNHSGRTTSFIFDVVNIIFY